MECVEIDRRFQHQLETDEDWALLCWGISTLEKLPSLETEAISNWPKIIEILPLFNFQVALLPGEGDFCGNEMSQDSLESCGFKVSESTPCEENLFEMISEPAGLMGELENIADTTIQTIDELLVMLLPQCMQNNFNENSTPSLFSSETPYTNHMRQLQKIDPELTIGLCSVMLSDRAAETFTNKCLNNL